MWVKANICILCSYRHGNNFRLSMHMHTRTGKKPFICSTRSKRSTMVHGCMAVWIHGKMDSWQFGFMAQWTHSSLDSWHYGCVAVWMHGIFENIPPATCGRPKLKHIMYAHPHLQKSPKTKNSKTFRRLV